MFRAAFCALGTCLMLWGAALFYVDTITLKPDAPHGFVMDLFAQETGSKRTIRPALWLPYTLVGVGIVTMLYAIALPRRQPRVPEHHH